MSLSHLFMKHTYPKAPLANGVGRYVKQLQRVTIKFCKSHGCSRGAREFIENDLLKFATDNPGVVFYAKPRRHRTPVLSAEYLNGKKKWIPIRNFTREEVNKYLNLLTTQSGEEDAYLRIFTMTAFPSVQGVWTPFTNRDPKLNVSTFPNKELSQPPNLAPSATELLLELYNKQKEKEKLPESQTQQKKALKPVKVGKKYKLKGKGKLVESKNQQKEALKPVETSKKYNKEEEKEKLIESKTQQKEALKPVKDAVKSSVKK